MSGGTTGLAMAFEDIPRCATRRTADRGAESRLLSGWSDLDAFVLLAEPGGGKSRAFEFEARASGGVCIKARTLANLGAPPGWQGETLFIDGFDEMRADAASRFGPLDTIIQRLNELGRPRFRLSCREADWLATVDSEALREVAPGKQLDALDLDPLTDPEVAELLRRRSDRIPNPDRFREQAKARGLDGLLRNPLLLELLVDAVGDAWPQGRADVYDLACKRMADEHNAEIRAANALKKTQPPIDQVLHDAGLLCAVLLLSGSDALIDGVSAGANAEVSIRALPATLGVKDANAALSTKLFVAEGQRRLPRHRSVAEYLAARAIGRRVTQSGLPVSRVLALMSGYDGGIVEPLRGLGAWLAVTCCPQRALLIGRDPLACVLYGDVHAFDAGDKRRVLDGLQREAERFVWFRQGHWAAHPFGALATADMAGEFSALLKSSDRSPAHQSLLGCVLDAICHGEPMLGLLPLLESVVRDGTFRDDVRNSALEAWLVQSGSNLSRARVWLDEIRNGVINDQRDELSGRLLDALYPQWLAPAEVMGYFHVSKTHNFVGGYRHFWSAQLIARTPAAARPLLADGLVAIGIPKDALHVHFEVPQIITKVIAASLDVQGLSVGIERAVKWLAVGLNEYGCAELSGDDSKEIREWLGQHPEVQKALVSHEYAQLQPDPQSGCFHFWSCEEILYRARRPRDWYRWLLVHAAQAELPALAEYCFREAAHAILRETPDFDIEMEEVERWVEGHRNHWPQADQWLEQAWSLPLDHYLGKQHHRQREHVLKRATEREQRRAELIEHLTGIESGRALPHVMHNVALAYRGRFTDIRGETPEERVRELLGGDADEAARAIAGLEATLARDGLPSVEDILGLDLERRGHYIRPACLLGAELVCARDPMAPLGWSDELVRQLIAFRLTEGTGEDPAWYKCLIQHRSHVVAEVLGAYARQCLIRQAEHPITGLWPLAREESQAELARIIIPPLLRDFPVRARSAQLRQLNTELLPAALRHLPTDEFKLIVNERLAMACIDSGQRVAWLVVALHSAAHQRSRQLSQFVGSSRARAVRLGSTLELQSDHAVAWPRLPAAALARLIEKLAPHTVPDFPLGAGWVGHRDRLRDRVRGLIHQLAALDDESVAAEIVRLSEQPKLIAWKVAFDSALFDHVRAMRSARYSHASAESVANALSGQAPANALDLAALVGQHLQDLQAHLRGDDTNSLRLFWRDPAPGTQAREPRVENECRDVLLGKLRDRLSGLNVTLHKEAAHANDTRADLRAETMVVSQRKVVPIEIKKEDHPQLWTAWRAQLEHRYMTDPAAEGVGIYLVLWFGYQPKAEHGLVPANARELEERLIASVPPEDRARLQVRVLDLSLTPAQSESKKRARRVRGQRLRRPK